MKHNYIMIDIRSIESLIYLAINIYINDIDATKPKDETYPIHVYGYVQGMISFFDDQMIVTGHDLEAYWESSGGRRLRNRINYFKNISKERWLKQPLSPQQWN